MEQTDMRVAPLDQLAVQFQNQTQNTMCRRVLRAEVKVEVADLLLTRKGVFEFGAVHYAHLASKRVTNFRSQRIEFKTKAGDLFRREFFKKCIMHDSRDETPAKKAPISPSISHSIISRPLPSHHREGCNQPLPMVT